MAERRSSRGATSRFARVGAAVGDLVAVGGSLAPAVLLDAYRHGVFPWYGEDDPVLWWSPDPRAILPLDALHVPQRLERTIDAGRFEVTVDRDFEAVMRACGEKRRDGTWIHEAMVASYTALHERGDAHSLEVRRDGDLVGGIYGVSAGGLFAAESMFHRARDASKVALVALARRLEDRGYALLDVQFVTPHLAQFGAVEIPRVEYLSRVKSSLRLRPRPL